MLPEAARGLILELKKQSKGVRCLVSDDNARCSNQLLPSCALLTPPRCPAGKGLPRMCPVLSEKGTLPVHAHWR